MPHSRGPFYKSRGVMRKKPRQRGKLGLSRILRQYKPGDRVVIKIEPSVHKGMPHRRYHGRVGVVAGRRGLAYMVNVKIGGKQKLLYVRPEHLVPHMG
ncbi:50S ribosomal protein L21e [Candidatus Bathyarchaeota archaeon]|nr:MAG: 50S ribosomal protein L21e [Candidatus Bathyarchaeota archaeon]HDI42393.1 50S ribosomal protein L21e [Candidatus Bathyarchaeota archaeon]